MQLLRALNYAQSGVTTRENRRVVILKVCLLRIADYLGFGAEKWLQKHNLRASNLTKNFPSGAIPYTPKILRTLYVHTLAVPPSNYLIAKPLHSREFGLVASEQIACSCMYLKSL